MSNAWSIACRPLAGLRLSALPPCAIARSIAARCPSTASRCSSTTPFALGLPRHHHPPPLRFLACRQFSTSPSVSKKARKSTTTSVNAKSDPKPPHPNDKKQDQKTEDAPLPGGDLPASKIAEIFGPGVAAAQGNGILRALQHRRQTGSLVDKGVHFDYVAREQALKGIEYLRAAHPLDEQAAAAAYAEAEAERIQGEMVARAQQVGLYKKDPIYGYSELDAVRARNEAAYEEELRQKKLEEERAHREAVAAGKSGATAVEKSNGRFELRRPQESEFTKYYKERGTLSQEKAPPEMSYIRRVGPSVLVCLAVVSLCYLFATTYTAPSRTARIWPDTPPALSTNLFLLSVNLLVFLAWRLPPCWRTMNKYFIMTPGQPTALSVLGSVFSHHAPRHLLANMLLMMLFGPFLHDLVGRANYVAIFVAGGALGATASLVRHAAAGPAGLRVSTLGASGALHAVMAAYLLLADADARRLPFTDYELPLPGRAVLALVLAFELLSMRRPASSSDHVAHLAGMASGAAAALLLQRRVRRLAEERARGGEQTHAQGAALVAQAHHRQGDLMVDWDAIKARVPYWMGGTKR